MAESDSSYFLALPTEMQKAVVTHVVKQHDLRNLRFACKQMRELALAKVYREVSVELSNWRPDPLYLDNNPGHTYVRQIVFNIPDEYGTLSNDECYQGITDLLHLLPENKLKTVQIDWRLPMNESTIRLLADRQPDIKAISLGPLQFSLDDLPEYIKPWPKSMTSLEIPVYVGQDHDLELYRTVLRHSPHIQHLALLSFDSWLPITEGSKKFEHEMNDSATRHGRLATILGASSNADYYYGPFMNPTWLYMQEISLHFAARSFSRIIDFGKLKYLHLRNCPGTKIFLRILTAQFRKEKCCLQGFSWVAWEEEYDFPIPFLGSFTGLRYLRIALDRYPDFLDLPSITQHSATLAHLYLGFGSNSFSITKPYVDVPVYPLRILCQQCVKIQQITMSLPDVVLEGYEATASNDYNKFLDVVASLPELTVLHILTWPIAPFNCGPMWDNDFDNHLQKFASEVLTRLTATSSGCRVKLLCFGNSYGPDFVHAVDGTLFPVKLRCFLPDRDNNGDGKVVAIPMEPHLVMQEIPEWITWDRVVVTDQRLGMGHYAHSMEVD